MEMGAAPGGIVSDLKDVENGERTRAASIGVVFPVRAHHRLAV
jgi:hypothetical protein